LQTFFAQLGPFGHSHRLSHPGPTRKKMKYIRFPPITYPPPPHTHSGLLGSLSCNCSPKASSAKEISIPFIFKNCHQIEERHWEKERLLCCVS
jgi:hypothetical protein